MRFVGVVRMWISAVCRVGRYCHDMRTEGFYAAYLCLDMAAGVVSGPAF